MSSKLDYCREKAAPEGSNFHYASLFESQVLRSQILPVFALHYEISACLTASTDPGVTRIKLDWWFDELGRLVAHKPGHPVTISLHHFLNESQIDTAPFLHYLATIVSIVGRPPDISMTDWFDRMSLGLGQIWIPAAGFCGIVNSPLASVLQRNGGTIFLLEILQNVYPLTSRGYSFLPEDLLKQHGLTASDLDPSSGNPAIKPMFELLIEMVIQQLDSCYAYMRDSQQDVRWYNLIMNRLARNVCSEIRRDGYQLVRHKIALTPVRKLWIATRTRYYK